MMSGAGRPAWFGKAWTVFVSVLGCFLVAAGLELFLLPNRVGAGGLTGISVMVSHVTEMQLSLLLFLFNTPFILYRARFVARSPLAIALPLIGVGSFAYLLQPVSALVDEPLLAALGGGICLGLGFGMVLRQGGRFDESETAVRLLPLFRSASPDEVIFWINLFILSAAGLVFGWQQALYSVIAHALAYSMTEIGFMGFSPYKRFWVRSKDIEAIRSAASASGLPVRWFSGDEDYRALCVVHRAEAALVKRLCKELDAEAEFETELERARNSVT